MSNCHSILGSVLNRYWHSDLGRGDGLVLKRDCFLSCKWNVLHFRRCSQWSEAEEEISTTMGAHSHNPRTQRAEVEESHYSQTLGDLTAFSPCYPFQMCLKCIWICSPVHLGGIHFLHCFSDMEVYVFWLPFFSMVLIKLPQRLWPVCGITLNYLL